MHSRRIVLKGYRGGKQIITHIWCKAFDCDNCPVKYKCFTSEGDIEVRLEDPAATKVLDYKWRLRDSIHRIDT